MMRKRRATTPTTRIVKITWLDVASVDVGLFLPGEIDITPPKAEIVGFLVEETKDAYCIAKEHWETGQFKYLHIIPKKTAILKVEEVK